MENIASYNEQVIISAAGKNGTNGDSVTRWRAPALIGKNGADGDNAFSSTAGEDAGIISVKLSPSFVRGTMFVEVGPETKRFVEQKQNLLLDCRGGDGGDGGDGQDGQDGGKGKDGTNANQHSQARNGGNGGNGGSGGLGTSGARGGNGGIVRITVNEDDLDLLVPVEWNVEGGLGGKKGKHGKGGIGGKGGNGGAGFQRTDINTHTFYYWPAGHKGYDGRSGLGPETLRGSAIYNGNGGVNGIGYISVIGRSGLFKRDYTSRYKLKLVRFDVVDSNQDGIFEPGESLFVKNVVVKNVGGMPTPDNHVITIEMERTEWLVPIRETFLSIPTSIPAGGNAHVPGVLKATIMEETVARKAGTAFYKSDKIKLTATLDRIQRILPEFTSTRNVQIKYPVVLEAPRYSDCVSQGDEVMLSWTIRNISSKEYGSHGSGRGLKTTISNTGDRPAFMFVDHDRNEHREIDILVHFIAPRSAITVRQMARVLNNVPSYSTADLKLELKTIKPESATNEKLITEYQLNVQICVRYIFNRNSSYLLIVNSQTENHAIHSIACFIQDTLHLELDIYNVSYYGGFIEPTTQLNVIENYIRKSVIIFGNNLSSSRTGTNRVWELLDPVEVHNFLELETSIHFTGIETDGAELKKWANMINFPIKLPRTSDVESFKDLTDLLKQDHTRTLAFKLPTIRFLVRKPKKALEETAEKLEKHLNEIFPLRRFLISTEGQTATPESPGHVLVQEGLPMMTEISASSLGYQYRRGLTRWSQHMIVAALPFKIRAEMFWHMGGGEEVLVPFTTPPGYGIANDELKREILTQSLMQTLTKELTIFIAHAPWPDPIPKSQILDQLPLLAQFFFSSHQLDNLEKATNPSSRHLSNILGYLLGTLLPIGLRETVSQRFTRVKTRKCILKIALSEMINKALTGRLLFKELDKETERRVCALKSRLKVHKEKNLLGTLVRMIQDTTGVNEYSSMITLIECGNRVKTRETRYNMAKNYRDFKRGVRLRKREEELAREERAVEEEEEIVAAGGLEERLPEYSLEDRPPSYALM